MSTRPDRRRSERGPPHVKNGHREHDPNAEKCAEDAGIGQCRHRPCPAAACALPVVVTPQVPMRGELDEGEDALQRRSRHQEPEYRLARDSDAGADRQEVVDHRADRDGEEDDLQRPR